MPRRSLKRKNVLITAGPTWASIDKVRVLSNISTGKMGLLLAHEASSLGFNVDLLLGPSDEQCFSGRINILRHRYFSELSSNIKDALKRKKYDMVFHAAAVSDFLPRPSKGKISSKKAFVLKLYPAPKLINLIKKFCGRAFLVSFKLEAGVKDALLIRRGTELLKETSSDAVVANTFDSSGKYKGFILFKDESVFGPYNSRKRLVRSLLKFVQKK